MPQACAWATAQKPHTLTIDSASSCRACCSRATDAALWKRRSKAAINGQFSTCRRCIECLPPSCFVETQSRLATSKRGKISDFIVSLCLPRTWAEYLSWFYSTKGINPSPFIRRLKVKTSSRLRTTNNATKGELLRRLFMSVAATSKFTKWAIGKFLRRRVNLVATNL